MHSKDWLLLEESPKDPKTCCYNFDSQDFFFIYIYICIYIYIDIDIDIDIYRYI